MSYINILAFPKYKNNGNPNISNIYKYFEKTNIKIHEFTLTKPFTKRYDIFHLHWPDYFFVKSRIYTIIRILYFLVIIMFFKIKKTKLIWTIHNLQPHKNYHPILFDKILNIWTQIIDGFIVMSNNSRELVENKFPALKYKDSETIYHGLYENYPNSTNKYVSRKKLKIGLNKKVILFFGRIEKYKGLKLLMESFCRLDSNYHLIVAGKFEDYSYYNEIKRKSINNTNITIFPHFIQENDIQYYFNASNLVVLPFNEIMNSGSLLLALSFNKPVLCPNKGSISEISNLLNHNAIITYDQLDHSTLLQAVSKCVTPELDKLVIFKNSSLWTKLYSFYMHII